MNHLRSALEVRTAQGVRLRQPLAGPLSRAVAVIIDTVIVMALSIGLLLAIVVLNVLLSALGIDLLVQFTATVSTVFVIIAFFLLQIGYPMYMEWRNGGQTPGKRAMGLRTVDIFGRRLGPQQIILRNLLRMVDGMPGFYGIAGATLLLNRRNQRLGDLLADTAVVSIRTPTVNLLRERLTREENSLRGHPHIEAQLRRAITPVRAALLAQAIHRRNQLEDDARLALYAELATSIRRLSSLPHDLATDLSDEQLIRNTLDIVQRTRLGT